MAAKSDIGQSTPEQQAALHDLTNGWTRQRVLEAVAATGTIQGGAQVSGLDYSTITRHAAKDPEFASELAEAKRRAGEKLITKSVAAVLRAKDEQLLAHPTLAIAGVNWLLPEMRPNAPSVNIYNDNRQLLCSIDQIHQAMRELEASTQQALPAASEAEVPIEADTEEPPF
ncbi:MAG: hypothetical protein KGI38_12620 [Thaumarchaeota archaeon]|nr:hypothetical protein [Nitrososphaerota archaeon]